MTNKNFFGIIAISFVCLVLLSGCSQQASPASTPTPNPSTPTPQETPVATPTPEQLAETPLLVDCKTDFDCFIAEVEKGNETETLHTVTLNLFGILQTGTTKARNHKLGVSGNYEYYQRAESITVEYSEELEQQMLDSGLSQEEINQQEQKSNMQAQLTVGTEATCEYDNPADLVDALNKWKAGNYSTNDFDFCTKFTSATPTPETTPAETPAGTQTPEPTAQLTYSAADCTILSAEDIKTACGDSTVTAVKVEDSSKLCVVEFKSAVDRKIRLEVTAPTNVTPQYMVDLGINAAGGTAVGTTGVELGEDEFGPGANIAKDKYLLVIKSNSFTTPATWTCTKAQMIELVELIQSR
ncbi:MAG: hypothetical protein NT067_00285 [Candidatus Diapherotrites archaeon]|nr:hypothetical protein [Candidatus Diapherotrites archaeon]